MKVQVLQRIALVSALAVAGCGSHGSKPVPVACKEGPGPIRAALARAPARVELGGTPLSGCLTRGAEPADVQQVGAAYVSVAAELAEVARGKPEGQEALRLGYLVAAARRGAGGTQGIHDELIRRIEQETNGVDTGSAAYRRGYRAGRDHG